MFFLGNILQLLIILATTLISITLAREANVVPQLTVISPTTESKCSNISYASNAKFRPELTLRFRLPFMDIEIQNQRNLRLLQEPQKGLIFVLHGSELYQFFITRQEKRLSLVGTLEGRVRDVEYLGAEVFSWHNYLLLIVALEEHLEIYQISEEISTHRAEITKKSSSSQVTPGFQPIQHLMLPGKFRSIFITSPDDEKVLLIAVVNFTSIYGRFKTFEWMHTYFDPVEELTVPMISMCSMLGVPRKYLISGRSIKHKSRTILTTYEIQSDTMRLKARQTLTVDSRTVHMLTFRGRSYAIACSRAQSKCNSFRMSADTAQFSVYRTRNSEELAFNQLMAGKHFVVGARLNEIHVYPNGRLDCYASFRTNESDVSTILSHVNEQGEDYVLLTYVRPYHTLVRVVELEDASGALLGQVALNRSEVEDLSIQHQHAHIFEDAIGHLRSMLLRRKQAMDAFRKLSNILAPKMKQFKSKFPVMLQAGNIGIVKLIGKHARSPQQLLQRVKEMTQKYRGTRHRRYTAQTLCQNQTRVKRLKARRLRVVNLLFNGNIVSGFHLDERAQPLPILSIRPLLTTHALLTTELKTRPRHRTLRQPSLGGLFDLETVQTVRTRRVHVRSINGIEWAELYGSLFLRTRDARIEGRLILQAETRISQLQTELLNDLAVSQFFNLVQPQRVRSDVIFAGFFASELQAERVNGLDFSEDIVFSGVENFVASPVIMHDISISGDLLLGDNSKMSRFPSGTEADDDEDFQQTYTGNIIINGTLTIENLLREDTAEVLVQNISLKEQQLREQYLLNNTEQTFNAPVTIGFARLTAPSLTTSYLNGHPPEHHLLRSPRPSMKNSSPLYIIFMLAHIAHDLNCSDYTSRLANISRQVVRRGDLATITGVKHFQAPLSVTHLAALQLNTLPVTELILKSQLLAPLQLRDTKRFTRVHVLLDSNVTQTLHAQNLNSLPLRELLNYDYQLQNVTLTQQLRAANVVFHRINGIAFDEIFAHIKVQRDQRLVLHKQLIIVGDVHFAQQLVLNRINDIDWAAYEQSLVRQHEDAAVAGVKRFERDVVITAALQTSLLNSRQIQPIFASILSKTRAQTITGSYSFGALHISNMDVNLINETPSDAFIDMRDEQLRIAGDIVVPRISVRGNVTARAQQLQFDKQSKRLQQLPRQQQWRNMHVLGAAQWQQTSHSSSRQQTLSQLTYLRRHAVGRLASNNISGSVRLRRPLISKMLTTTKFPVDIDFDNIFDDCLLRNTTAPQRITGAKKFLQTLQLQRAHATALLSCPQLNNIDILRLNASLYRLSSGGASLPLMGPLRFKQTPHIGQLKVSGRVNVQPPAQIYYQHQTPLPPLHVAERIFIDNTLQLDHINEMRVDYLLQQRVRKHGAAMELFGFLRFEHLVLERQLLLQSINGIAIDNLVLRTSSQLQSITGAKHIEGDLLLGGPAHVLRLNGRALIDCYQQSIFMERAQHIDELIIDRGSFEQGLLWEQEPLLAAVQQEPPRLNTIARDLSAIDNLIDNTLNKRRLLYLQHDISTELFWQQPNVSIDASYSCATKRLTVCAREWLLAQQTSRPPRIYLCKFTSNLLLTQRGNLSVKVENLCGTRARKMRSKITLSGGGGDGNNYRKLSKVFGMKRHIETLELMMPDASQSYVLLHAADVRGQRNEVRLLHVTPRGDVNDAQLLTRGIGKVLRLFELTPQHTLLLSATLTDNYPTLSVFVWSLRRRQFELAQVIDGDFDVIECVRLGEERYQLLLTCVRCNRISIYEYVAEVKAEEVTKAEEEIVTETEIETVTEAETASKENMSPLYRIFQLLQLQQPIDKLLAFSLIDGDHYLLVLSEREQDYYHLYRYSQIQGWQHLTYGYFHNIQLAVPLMPREPGKAVQNLQLLLCGKGESVDDKCSLVTGHVQQ